jgi:putrescine aminotransferase
VAVSTERTKEELIDDAVRYTWRQGTPVSATQRAGGPIAVSGSGVRITDFDGNTYLDGLGGGSAAATIGYGRAEVADAVAEQLKKLHYASFRTFLNEPAIELGRRIGEIAPGDLMTSFFTSSGSEAVETAAQIIKAYHKQKGQPEKSKVIYRTTGFHGVSLIAASASGSPDYRDWFQPLLPDFYEVPTMYTYRRPEGMSVDEYADSCAQALEDEILRQGPETVGALFAEAIPAGLILPPTKRYLKRVREICDKYDVVWLDDEVFIGFGRTGKYFGCEHYDVTPDIATASKGITGGYIPLGAAIVSERLMDVLFDDKAAGQAKVHGHTYSGHAGACAGGIAVMDFLARENVVENVARLGDRMISDFGEFGQDHPHVGDVRGKGFLIAIEIVEDKETRKPFAADAGIGRKVVASAMKNNFLVRSARDVVAQSGGLEIGDIITLFPSFVATDEDVEQMIAFTKQAITEATGA